MADAEHGGLNVGGEGTVKSLALTVYGDDLDPDELSQFFGVTPSSSNRKGDPRRREGQAPYRSGAWIFSIDAESGERIDDLTRRLRTAIPQKPEAWAQVSSRHKVALSFRLLTHGWNNDFELSAETVAFAALLGASVYMDVYAEGSDESD
jgi:hypothetical protein